MTHRSHLVAQVGRQEHLPKMRQIDLPQQPPGQAQAQAYESVQGAYEDSREYGLHQ